MRCPYIYIYHLYTCFLFVCSSFNDGTSKSECAMSKVRAVNELWWGRYVGERYELSCMHNIWE